MEFLEGSPVKPETGKPTINKLKEIPTDQGFDIDKLARAVAKHETADCTAGSARYNNCFGIMQWDKKGNRSFKRFASKEDSYTDFRRIWLKSYGGTPNLAKAKKYSGNDRASIWLKNVSSFYHSL